MKRMHGVAGFILSLSAGACSSSCGNDAEASVPAPRVTDPAEAFEIEHLALFDEAWAMTFLPDGRLLVTEKRGALRLFDPERGETSDVGGVPEVAYGGQGGLGDVVLHPEFDDDARVYLSYAEAGDGGRGAAVARARLREDEAGARLEDLEVIWRQTPKTEGEGHYGHRLAFSGGMLFITSGDRQLLAPAQDLDQTLGKIVRIHDDGTVPEDNPFGDRGGVSREIWTLGHRNPLGIAFDAEGRLFAHEMGPRGGDELNAIERGKNYGWPLVSEGRHYDLRDIPDHETRPEFEPPRAHWTPVISPAGMIFYGGDLFRDWRGDAFIGGLSSESLVRVEFDEGGAREAERFDMGERIREVEEGPDGAIYLLEDGGSRLLRLSPKPGAR